jgi:hypothetical protein
VTPTRFKAFPDPRPQGAGGVGGDRPGRARGTQADTEYLARELAAIRLALGEMPTREYLGEALERLESELERLRAQVQPGSAADLPQADDPAV